MPKYVLAEEDKPKKLEKKQDTRFAVKYVTCTNCGNRQFNSGKQHEYITCTTCHYVFENPTYDGY